MLIRDMTEEERFSIRVVDVEDRENAVRELVGNTGMADRVVFQQSAIQDLHWVEAKDRAFILCTDDDLGNLTLAMSLVKKAANTTIHVRMSHWPLSAVAGHLCEAEGLVFINVIELVSQGLPEIPGLFEAARPSDLKRVDVASCCTAPENRSHSHS